MKKGFRALLFSTLLSALFACGGEKDLTTTVIINSKNYNAEKVNLAWKIGEDYSVNGVELVDGKGNFTFELPANTKISLAALDDRAHIPMGKFFIPGPRFAFFAQPGTIEITFDMDKWPILTITGGENNSDLNNYWAQFAPLERERFELTRKMRTQSEELSEEEMKDLGDQIAERAKDIDAIKLSYIKENPKSMTSLELLAERLNKHSIEEFEGMFNSLSRAIRNSEQGVEVATAIANNKATQPGMPAPNFAKKDMNGKEVTLADYKGSYVLIDFWGTWCQPCRDSHPHLVELYNKYSPKGLKFLNVAQESSLRAKDKWLKAIEEDGLVWTQILNNEGIDECDMVKLFSIKAFPTKVLIDNKGNIINSWVGSGKGIDKELERIFK